MSDDYQSDMLRCFVDDDHCAVCRFLAGSRDVDDMLEVIRLLDERIAETDGLLEKQINLAINARLN